MDIILLVVAAALIVFMFVSSNRRRKKMQAEEQERQRQMVPGTRVMTRSGLYGTLVEFDPEDLTVPAVIEIAPGVEIEVHAQTVTLDQNAHHLAADEADEDEYDDEIEEPVDGDLDDITITDEDVYDGLLNRDETKRDETPGDSKNN